MSVVSRRLGSADRAKPRLAPAAIPGWMDVLLTPLGVCFLLAGPTALLWPGFLFVLLGWLARWQAWTQTARQAPLEVGWIALLSGSLIGFVVSPNAAAAVSRLAAVVAAVTLFFWLRDQVRSAPRLRLAGWVLVGLCGIGALLLLALIRGQLPPNVLTRLMAPLLSPFIMFPGLSGDVLEINSRFPVHQYGLAYLCLVMAPFLAAEAALGADTRKRITAAFGVLALGVLVAATETRGAVLALAVAVALVGSFRSRWLWALLPLVLVALYVLLARGFISRSIETDWLNTRLSIWGRSLNLLVDYPFSGAGLGIQTFAEVFAWNYGLPNPYLVVHAHNIFIQAYAEQGLLGLVGLLLILGGGLLFAWRAARRPACLSPAIHHPDPLPKGEGNWGSLPKGEGASAEARVVAVGVLGALVASTLYGLTDQVPTTNDGLAILSVLCALALAGARLAPNAAPREPAVWHPPSPAYPAHRARESHKGALMATHPLTRSPTLLVAALATVLLIGTASRWASGLTLNFGSAQLTGVALSRVPDVDRKTSSLERAELSLGLSAAWNPQNVTAYRQLGMARLLRHDVQGAIAALNQAQTSGALNDYERTQLGRLYLQLGFWQQAFDLWKAARQEALLSQAADDLAGRNELKAAAAAHAALAELNPDAPETLSNLAKAILAAEGAVSADEAIRWFERAAELNPEARRSLARQLTQEADQYRINERRGGGRFDRAVFWLSLASRLDPSYDRPEVELGEVYFYAGSYPEAAAHFQAAVAIDPQNSSSWHQLGQAEEAAGRLSQAAAAFEKAVQAAPARARLRVSLARVYARVWECKAALSELDEAFRLESGIALTQAELAGFEQCR